MTANARFLLPWLLTALAFVLASQKSSHPAYR